ncbi:MAG: RloB domain-containing protein [Burkholderiales bacterium]|nr:RloB domain-containing protein [Burkholderiales bacterium]
MAKYRQNKPYKQLTRYLVLCEGHTEVWYLEKQLDPTKYKVEKSKYNNALKLVELDAVKKQQANRYDWNKIYCVFDRDSESNTKEQLQHANKCIKKSEGNLIKVFSSPCFEIVFLFNFVIAAREFNNYKEVENALEKKLKLLKNNKEYKDYKNQYCINKICELTDFKEIGKNAQLIYENLDINDNNWLEITDGFSEIFKLIESNS